MPTNTPTPRPVTTLPPLDPQRVVRPWSHRDDDQDHAVLHWQSLVDRGLIGGNPPPSAEVVAQREANAAVFRGLARRR